MAFVVIDRRLFLFALLLLFFRMPNRQQRRKNVVSLSLTDPGVPLCFSSSQEAAREVVRVSASRLLSDGVPFCVIGHSLGTWLAFEVASLLREKGLPQPRAAFLSAFPAPDIPEGDRPWKVNRHPTMFGHPFNVVPAAKFIVSLGLQQAVGAARVCTRADNACTSLCPRLASPRRSSATSMTTASRTSAAGARHHPPESNNATQRGGGT